ncbi:hypothetical protein, partial [Cnuella takakiae]|uniref:hypothetical protein n=1 Tax=Cnuella takakiae TaxID=1302690 RepID=UPI001C1FEF4A
MPNLFRNLEHHLSFPIVPGMPTYVGMTDPGSRPFCFVPYQPFSITNHQSPITNHQSPITNH